MSHRGSLQLSVNSDTSLEVLKFPDIMCTTVLVTEMCIMGMGMYFSCAEVYDSHSLKSLH